MEEGILGRIQSKTGITKKRITINEEGKLRRNTEEAGTLRRNTEEERKRNTEEEGELGRRKQRKKLNSGGM